VNLAQRDLDTGAYRQRVDQYPRPNGTALQEISVASAVDAGLALWGPDLFAYLLGAGVNLPLAQWRLDEVLKDQLTRARLRTVQDLAAQFENNPPAARAWVRRRNPELGARPAEVIRRGTEDDLQQVRELAERQVRKA